MPILPPEVRALQCINATKNPITHECTLLCAFEHFNHFKGDENKVQIRIMKHFIQGWCYHIASPGLRFFTTCRSFKMALTIAEDMIKGRFGTIWASCMWNMD